MAKSHGPELESHLDPTQRDAGPVAQACLYHSTCLLAARGWGAPALPVPGLPCARRCTSVPTSASASRQSQVRLSSRAGEQTQDGALERHQDKTSAARSCCSREVTHVCPHLPSSLYFSQGSGKRLPELMPQKCFEDERH